jgi:hypothetical protein
MTSIIHTSELNDSSSNSSTVASLQFDPYFSEVFDITAYFTDTGSIESDANMDMPLEEFCPEIEFLNNDVRPAKASLPATTSPSRTLMHDSNIEQASDSSAAISSLSVPVIHRSEPLPCNLQPSVSGVITRRGGESQPSPSSSEASEVTDDEFLESEPREADKPTPTTPTQHSSSSAFIDLTDEDNEQSASDKPESSEADKPTPTTPTQHSSSSAFIDLTDEDNEQSASDKPESSEADKPTPTTSTQYSSSSAFIDLTEEDNEQSTSDKPESSEADKPTPTTPTQHSSSSSFIDLTEEDNKQSIVLQETQKIDNLYLSSKFRNPLL